MPNSISTICSPLPSAEEVSLVGPEETSQEEHLTSGPISSSQKTASLPVASLSSLEEDTVEREPGVQVVLSWGRAGQVLCLLKATAFLTLKNTEESSTS